MKKNTSCCDAFDQHNEFVVEFKPCEIAKQFDVSINMGDCTCLPWDKYHSHKDLNEKCDENCCNNDFLLILIVVLVIRYFNSKCGEY